MQPIFDALADLSFRKFVTPKIMKYIYVLGILACGAGALGMFRLGLLGMIIAPIYFIASVVFLRMFMEMALALFQIAKYTGEMARRGRSPGETPAPDELPEG